MTWAGTAIAVGTAAVGAVSANQQRKAQQKSNQANANISAAQAQYSPWTGMQASTPKIEAPPDNTFGAAAQGALGGAMFAKQNGIGKLGEKADPDFDPENWKDTSVEDSVKLDDPSAQGMISPTTAPLNMDNVESDMAKYEDSFQFGKRRPKKSAWSL